MGLNTILNLLAQYNIDANELLLLYLTFIARDDEGHPEYFAKWYNNGGCDILKNLFNSLKDKGIIHKNYNPESYNPNDIEFNKSFIKSWMKCSGEMGKELFDAYPSFIQIKNKLAPLKNISRKYDSLEEMYFNYSVQIGHSLEKHKEVLELLKWGIEKNIINYSICEFIISHKWEELKYLKENGFDSEIAFDTMLEA